jgi:hypothetical protein
MTSLPGGTRSLDSVGVGELVTLGDFAFASLREACADIGLLRGARVRCRVHAPGVLLLEREDGTQVRLDPQWARLIGIAPAQPLPGLASTRSDSAATA